MRHHMRAVTLASGAMPEAMTFSTPRGFTLVDASPPARFRTLPAGDALINRAPAPHVKLTWWGRTMVRVDNVETLDAMAVAQGWTPSALRHGSWGERSFSPHGSLRACTQLCATPLINSNPRVFTQPTGEEQRVIIRSEISLI
jgi:hypothetical protein